MEADFRGYLKAAAEAERESLAEHAGFVGFIDELDSAFRGLVTGKTYGSSLVCSFLGINAHASFLAAASTAIRGQAPATFAVLRSCVESAAYAFLVSQDKSDGDLWLARHQRPDEMRAKFTVNRAVQKLSSDPELAAKLKETYQWMIEFGGHPNPRSVVDHVRFKEEANEGHPVSFIYIQSPGTVGLVRSLSATIENGCIALAIMCHAMEDHPEMHATFDRAWTVWQDAQKHMADEGYYTPDDSAG